MHTVHRSIATSPSSDTVHKKTLCDPSWWYLSAWMWSPQEVVANQLKYTVVFIWMLRWIFGDLRSLSDHQKTFEVIPLLIFSHSERWWCVCFCWPWWNVLPWFHKALWGKETISGKWESSSGKKWDFQLWTECQVCLTLSACGETTIWSEFSANNLKILSLPSLKSTFSQPVLMCWWGSESWCNYNFHLSKLCDVIFMLCGVISLVTYYRVHLKFHSWGWKGFKGFSLKLLSIFNISLHNTSE